jgi:murein DD-endopeptidase MepM/ murein hydrolase activator NlpD
MGYEGRRLSRLRSQLKGGRKKRKRWLILPGLILVGVSLAVYFFGLSPPEAPVSERTPEPADNTLQEGYQVVEGQIKEKSTFFESLVDKNISLSWVDLIISKLRPHIDFKRIRGGSYQITLDKNGDLVRFIYEESPLEVYEIERDGEGYVARKKEVPVETYLVKVGGEVSTSLFEAMEASGEQDSLVISFAEVLAWEIDFYKDVREGDRFKVVVEKVYKGDQFIQYGDIRAVEYRSGMKIIRGIEYQGNFYDENGASLRKAFLKVPLRFNQISSRFSRARKHPILGGVFPHFGVDYAAPPGTPVWAVADGTVVSCGWNNGFGNQVTLRHMNGYMTYYGHLSQYGPGIRKGARVKQKQIIAYVGSTGLSTGPHLDYRLAKDGRFRNPLKESFPAGVPVGKSAMEGFQKRRDEMRVWLEGEVPYKKIVVEAESSQNR